VIRLPFRWKLTLLITLVSGVTLALSMAGLPASRAWVSVGPPLFWSEPSRGLIGLEAVPTRSPVVAVITTLEERFGLIVGDDEIDGSTFATVGTLADFVAAKL